MHIILTLLLSFSFLTIHGQQFERDVINTSDGPLTITFIGHGSLMMEFKESIIHIDASSREADYGKLPDADLILITHHHGDHCDPAAVEKIKKESTTTVLTALAEEKLGFGKVINNNETFNYQSVQIEAIPAYNLVHKRDNGDFFHPKGCCNSYILNIGDKRIFIGGDTENTPEMKALSNIDIAFLPMNLPYTMTPEMVADAAKAFRPKILYPYHYGTTDTSIIQNLLKNEKDIEVRIRKMP
ncbi:MBL fold metallo-hydrolase [Fulvivirga ulvae]|uniref:MBL fold metallo-hydrolase n=1 Tax=Fulvivirga ulvae TaxID=2904245 RepID=UPI001F2FF12C|nr:MBL fold metallo-hydrolase [Fulvivirga ulvae]UII33756.1 MBL fold metallo-hydrolase [Fulvivirga ulvae]